MNVFQKELNTVNSDKKENKKQKKNKKKKQTGKERERERERERLSESDSRFGPPSRSVNVESRKSIC